MFDNNDAQDEGPNPDIPVLETQFTFEHKKDGGLSKSKTVVGLDQMGGGSDLFGDQVEDPGLGGDNKEESKEPENPLPNELPVLDLGPPSGGSGLFDNENNGGGLFDNKDPPA